MENAPKLELPLDTVPSNFHHVRFPNWRTDFYSNLVAGHATNFLFVLRISVKLFSIMFLYFLLLLRSLETLFNKILFLSPLKKQKKLNR